MERDEEEKKINNQVNMAIHNQHTDLGVSQEYVRDKYIDNRKMREAKEAAYKDLNGKTKKTIIDPYTGQVLHKDSKAAERKYGKDASKQHTSQTDHIVAAKAIHDKNKRSAWLTDNDIKKAANIEKNYKEISAHDNMSMKDKSYKEYYVDGKRVGKGKEEQVLEDYKKAYKAVKKSLRESKIHNVKETSIDGAKGALIGATPGLVVKGAKDIVSVIKKEKTMEEATLDLSKDVVKIGTSGAVKSVANRQFTGGIVDEIATKTSQKILKKPLSAKQIGEIAGLALSLKDCTERYCRGEIASGEYLIELVEDGVGHIVSTVTYAVGEMIGGPLCAAVCSYVFDSMYQNLIMTFRMARLTKKELEEVEKVKKYIIQKEKYYQEQLKKYATKLYADRQDEFNILMKSSYESIVNNDIDSFFCSMNSFSEKLGVVLEFETMQEFDEFMNSDDILVL